MPTRLDKAGQLQRIIETQTEIVQADLDLDKFMQKIVDTLKDLTLAKGAVVELVDGDHMVYRSASGEISQHVGLRLHRSGSLSGMCVASGIALKCDDSETDTRVDKEACRRVGVRSMVCTPLFQAGVPVGVLKVMSQAVGGFDDDDLQTLNLLAGMLGAALGKQLAFDAIHHAELRLRLILENANDAVVSIDESGKVIRWNHTAERLFGFTMTHVVGKHVASLGSAGDLCSSLVKMFDLERMESVVPKLNIRQEVQCTQSDGCVSTLEFHVNRTHFGSHFELTAFIHDVSERKALEKAMHNMALTDGLTGLPNRRHVMEAIEHAIARAKRSDVGMALLFMDLNGFKQINDLHGHETGDKVLREFSHRLSSCIRETDILGRLGGDEFVILALGTKTIEHASVFASKIVDALQAPVPGSGLALAASIGISLYRPPFDAKQWLHEADLAMYEAKKQGRQGSHVACLASEKLPIRMAEGNAQ